MIVFYTILGGDWFKFAIPLEKKFSFANLGGKKYLVLQFLEG